MACWQATPMAPAPARMTEAHRATPPPFAPTPGGRGVFLFHPIFYFWHAPLGVPLLLFDGFDLGQPGEDFVLGAVADGARHHQHDVGVGEGVRAGVPVLGKYGPRDLRVVDVHLAPVRLKVDPPPLAVERERVNVRCDVHLGPDVRACAGAWFKRVQQQQQQQCGSVTRACVRHRARARARTRQPPALLASGGGGGGSGCSRGSCATCRHPRRCP